jgi:hypothetical protein
MNWYPSKTYDKLKITNRSNYSEPDIGALSTRGGVYIGKDLVISSGIRIGNTTKTDIGTIKFTDGGFYGYNGSTWTKFNNPQFEVSDNVTVSDVTVVNLFTTNLYTSNIFATDITTLNTTVNTITINTDIVFGDIHLTSITISDATADNLYVSNLDSTNISNSSEIQGTTLVTTDTYVTDISIYTITDVNQITVGTITINTDLIFENTLHSRSINTTELDVSNVFTSIITVSDTAQSNTITTTTLTANSGTVTTLQNKDGETASINVETINGSDCVLTVNSDLMIGGRMTLNNMIGSDITCRDLTAQTALVTEIGTPSIRVPTMNVDYIGTSAYPISDEYVVFLNSSYQMVGTDIGCNNLYTTTLGSVNDMDVDNIVINDSLTYSGYVNVGTVTASDITCSDVNAENVYATNIGSLTEKVNNVNADQIDVTQAYIVNLYYENAYGTDIGCNFINSVTTITDAEIVTTNNITINTDITVGKLIVDEIVASDITCSDLTAYNVYSTNMTINGSFETEDLTINSDITTQNIDVNGILTINAASTEEIAGTAPLYFPRAWGSFVIKGATGLTKTDFEVLTLNGFSDITLTYAEVNTGFVQFNYYFNVTFTTDMFDENYAVFFTSTYDYPRPLPTVYLYTATDAKTSSDFTLNVFVNDNELLYDLYVNIEVIR